MRRIKTAVILLVAGITAFLLYKGPWQNLKENTAGDVLRTAVTAKVEELTGLSAEQAEDILDVIPAGQKEEIIKIAAEHITPSNLRRVIRLVQNKDEDGLVAYARQEFSTQEIEKVEQIAAQNEAAVKAKLVEYGLTEDKIAAELAELGG